MGKIKKVKGRKIYTTGLQKTCYVAKLNKNVTSSYIEVYQTCFRLAICELIVHLHSSQSLYLNIISNQDVKN